MIPASAASMAATAAGSGARSAARSRAARAKPPTYRPPSGRIRHSEKSPKSAYMRRVGMHREIARLQRRIGDPFRQPGDRDARRGLRVGAFRRPGHQHRTARFGAQMPRVLGQIGEQQQQRQIGRAGRRDQARRTAARPPRWPGCRRGRRAAACAPPRPGEGSLIALPLPGGARSARWSRSPRSASPSVAMRLAAAPRSPPQACERRVAEPVRRRAGARQRPIARAARTDTGAARSPRSRPAGRRRSRAGSPRGAPRRRRGAARGSGRPRHSGAPARDTPRIHSVSGSVAVPAVEQRHRAARLDHRRPAGAASSTRSIHWNDRPIVTRRNGPSAGDRSNELPRTKRMRPVPPNAASAMRSISGSGSMAITCAGQRGERARQHPRPAAQVQHPVDPPPGR